MPEELTISKNPKLAKSEDFLFLKSEGLKHIEELAHKLWTDYNIHDPGIQLLEVLCYAITDLGYRTSYDVKDILSREINNVVSVKGNFYTAFHILPNNPVTFNDLRKLLIDINGVRNSWININDEVEYCLDTFHQELKDCNGTPDKVGPLNGLYDVLIEYEDYVSTDERIVRVGRHVKEGDPGTHINTGEKGINFRVFHPLVLKSVSVYATGAPGDLKIRLLAPDESTVPIAEITHEITGDDGPIEIPLNFEIQPGRNYRLDAKGSTVKLYRNDTHEYPDGKQLLISLSGGWSGTADNNQYYFFYDWKINFSVSPLELDKLIGDDLLSNQIGLLDHFGSPGGYINTSDKGLLFDVFSPICLDAVYVIPETTGIVRIQILDNEGLTIFENETEVNTPHESTKINIDIELNASWDYKIQALGTSVKLYRNTTVDYPFEIENLVEIRGGDPSAAMYFFFYRWEIKYRHPVVQVAELHSADIQLAIRNRLFSYRNLCEDICHIRELILEDITVCSDIELSPEVNVNETLAEIFYQLELHVSPPVRFYTIGELQDKGYSNDQIFEGPILNHGFIDDSEFRKIEQRTEIRTSDIIQIIMDVSGVRAVKEIKLLSFTKVTLENPVEPGNQTAVIDGVKYIVKKDDWILMLEDPSKMAPNFNPELSKIIFYKNGLPYYANLTKVMELYQEKRARSLSGKLKGHDQDISIPIGEDKELEDYYPVQNDLPSNYLVGNHKVPESETDLRKGQSRQLKGYLLFFEQLLANYLSQLANVKELFSWEGTEIKTYFTQIVNEFSNHQDIYKLDEIEHIIELNKIIEKKETAMERKNRFLDHLMGRFAESLSEYSALMYQMFKEASSEKLIEDKREFLSNYALISSERGKAFDYRYPDNPDNMSGLAHRVSYLLGFENVKRKTLASDRVIPVQVTVTDGACTSGSYRFVVNVENGVPIFESICCSEKELICVLIDSAIKFGSQEENYQISEDTGNWQLFEPCTENVFVIGNFLSPDVAIKDEVKQIFSELFAVEGLLVIEHILLRKRTVDEDYLPVQLNNAGECDCPEAKDPYSFRVSIILPSWSERFQHIRFRQFVEETIRMETPAHIYPRICWINHCEMQKLEECHESWLTQHSEITEYYRGCLPLVDTNAEDFPEDDKAKLVLYQNAQKALVEKLYNLTNVFPTARLHDCKTVDEDNPQITLNDTNLGTL